MLACLFSIALAWMGSINKIIQLKEDSVKMLLLKRGSLLLSTARLPFYTAQAMNSPVLSQTFVLN